MVDAPLLLGLDIGTTSIKAIVFDNNGQIVAQASSRTPTHYPRPGWAHYDPEELWQTTVQTLRAVTGQLDKPTSIAGLAVASFAETGVPLDAEGQPTAEAIAWFDTRTAPQIDQLQAIFGQERLFAITGIALQPIFGLCKMMWLRQHAPEAFARTRLWLNVADYIAYRLSGVAATDFSLASRTLWLDLHKRTWSDEIMAGSGTPPTLLAPLLPSGSRLGPVLPTVAAITGLPTTAQVAVGGHDHVCGALALGVTAPGDVMNSIGTAEALFLPLAQALTDAQVGRQGYSQGVHTGGQYYIFGGLYTSGACIEWFREHLAGNADYATLTAEAERIPAGSLGVHFLPHLRLANPPRVDPLARGAFIGLRGDTGRGALFRAVLEGLAYEFRNSLEPLLQHAGLADVKRIYVAGGGAYNELALRIKASILNQPLMVASIKETTALGAAILGGLGAGVYGSLAEALAEIQYTHTMVMPDEQEAQFYESAFREIYHPLYQTLRPLHQAISLMMQ